MSSRISLDFGCWRLGGDSKLHENCEKLGEFFIAALPKETPPEDLRPVRSSFEWPTFVNNGSLCAWFAKLYCLLFALFCCLLLPTSYLPHLYIHLGSHSPCLQYNLLEYTFEMKVSPLGPVFLMLLIRFLNLDISLRCIFFSPWRNLMLFERVGNACNRTEKC